MLTNHFIVNKQEYNITSLGQLMSNAWSVSKEEGILMYGVWFTGKEGDRQLIWCPVDLYKLMFLNTYISAKAYLRSR